MNDAIPIEIYSDVVCPWCYVGKRRLERALERFQGRGRFDVSWHPFELNPTLPKEGMARQEYLEAKFGGLETFRIMEERLLEAAAEEGLHFAFDKIARTPNTLLAHRLIWYARKAGRQDQVVESLFRGYFEEGADVGSLPVLVELAGRAGLDAQAFLEGDEGRAEVRAEELAGQRLGIRAVPYFLLNRAYGLSGAQPVERFVSALEQVVAQRAAAAGAAGRR